MKRIITFLIMAVLAAVPALAQSATPFIPPSARMSALGGPHAASSAGLDAIFENPAGFATEITEIGVSALVINPAGPIFDIAGLIVNGSDQIQTALVSLFDAQNRLYVQADMLGPLNFAYVGRGLGFGLFNRTIATINATSLLNTSFAITEELLLAGGYAHRFRFGANQTLDIGIMPKGFVRANLGQRTSIDGIMALIGAPTTLMSDYEFTMTSGAGFDAGIRWSLDGNFAIGLVARDAFSPAMTTTYSSFNAFMADSEAAKIGEPVYALVPADIALGVAYNLPLAFLDRLGANLVFLVDYVDILDLFAIIPRNPILNVSIGVELMLLDILSLRAGIKDALPAAGFEVDLSIFEFSLTMYGEELGIEPGARPTYNLLVALDFRY